MLRLLYYTIKIRKLFELKFLCESVQNTNFGLSDFNNYLRDTDMNLNISLPFLAFNCLAIHTIYIMFLFLRRHFLGAKFVFAK